MKHLLPALLIACSLDATAQSAAIQFPRAALDFIDSELPAMTAAVEQQQRSAVQGLSARMQAFLQTWDRKVGWRAMERYPACIEAVTDLPIMALCKISRPGTICDPETFFDKVAGNVERCDAAAQLAAAQESAGSQTSRPGFKEISVELVNAANAPQPGAQPPDVNLAAFPLIQGALWGKVTQASVLHMPIRFDAPAQLPLDDLAKLVEPLATPASIQPDWRITPAQTRVARVATFFTQDETDAVSVGGGLLETGTRELVWLAYFSGPCQVQGRLSQQGVSLDATLDIPSAGFHWIKVVKSSPNRWHLELASASASFSLFALAPMPPQRLH